MSKIKQAQELLEGVGIEFYSFQLEQLEQAIKVEEVLGKLQEPEITYWSNSYQITNDDLAHLNPRISR